MTTQLKPTRKMVRRPTRGMSSHDKHVPQKAMPVPPRAMPYAADALMPCILSDYVPRYMREYAYSLFEEISRRVNQSTTISDLRSECETSNFSTTEIRAVEAVPVRSSLEHFHFEIRCSLHQGDGTFVLDWVGVG